ncbi:hypothetical protein L596_012879 [Steinernema carpocapsae]|uniref:Ribosomal protein S11 n=1 Tax=Steinernema carpocapsae TaxID=34508 RepID=A0A4U5NZA0_STECR|nr:hypothetical protein L596_012879 [Steinernema carpocapsae]
MAIRSLVALAENLSLGMRHSASAAASSICQRRFISTSPVLDHSIRDIHRTGIKIASTEIAASEGTTGAAETWISVDTSKLDRFLPTPEIFKQKFNGIAYEELPIVYIKATKNNTLIQVTDHKFNVITYTSCRLEGFKNARKKTNIAGQTTGVAAGQRLVRRGIRSVRVVVKGIGPGRMTAVKGLTVSGVNVISITDHTLINELGPRPRKIRRI